ncbi:MAG: aldehyde dehydrogenase family protein [Actinomycetota bacterium]
MADYKLFINGEFVAAEDGSEFETIDPSTGQPHATVAQAGKADAEKAIAAARAAFDDGRWSGLPVSKRADFLDKIAAGIKDRSKELAALETKDSGGTIRKTKGEAGGAMFTFRSVAEMARSVPLQETLPVTVAPGPSLNYLKREPLGVCAGIIPWNFALLMAAWKIAPAIAAGNTVVLKPSENSPCTALMLAEIIKEAGVPDGVVNIIPGFGPSAGEPLCASNDVDKIAFTGSTATGRRILQLASGNIKKVTLELGGKSANIILDDADLDLAVDGALYAFLFNSGQVCSSGTRLLVHQSLHDEVVARMVERAQRLVVGLPSDAKTDIGPIVSSTQLATVERYVKQGVEEGAKLVTWGERVSVPNGEGGYFFSPTIFTGVTNDMRIAQEEIFGPVLAVLPFESDDRAVAIANDSIYGLAGGVWSSDPARAMSVADRLRTGTVWINDYHLINNKYPFGGYKQSGLGREHGVAGYLEYFETKHVHVDVSRDRAKHRWFDVVVPPVSQDPSGK